MRIFILLVILATQLFLTSFCFNCKSACNDCMDYMTFSKNHVLRGKAKEVEMEMRKLFCGADPTKPEYSCLIKACTKLNGILVNLQLKTTPKNICIGAGFCRP